MKTILAYGDSLTFGMDAEAGRRHVHADQWPTVLEAGLRGARVINEGLGGRTTMFDDPSTPADRNGVKILPTVLGTHIPLDLVIIMLGSNDLKTFINGSAYAAALGMKRLAEIVLHFPYGEMSAVPQVLLVSPPLVQPATKPVTAPRSAEAKFLADHYRRVADEIGVGFFDAATVSTATSADGVHLDAHNTRAIGAALVPVVSAMLGIKGQAAA